MNSASGQSVTIVGAGAAGLSAALRLVARGYKVTVYEATGRAGGNAGVTPVSYGDKTVNFEVFPHMYGFWYDNFFDIAENELGLRRDVDFKACDRIGVIDRHKQGHLKFLENLGALKTVWQNLTAGVVPVADTILAFYAVLDLLTHDFSHTGDLIDAQTVNGFVVSRPYATEGVAGIFEKELIGIWSIDSYVTSAFAYQSFLKYQGKDPIPDYWLLKGDAYEVIFKPWVEKLKRLGVEFVWNTKVLGVTVEHGRAARICIASDPGLEENGLDGDGRGYKDPRIVPVENLIVAVPQTGLGDLALTSAEAARALAISNRYDHAARAIFEVEEILAEFEKKARAAERRMGDRPGPARASAGRAERVAVFREQVGRPGGLIHDLLEDVAEEYAEKASAPRNQFNTIAGQVPSLASTRATQHATQAILYIPFNRKLPGIPDYFVYLSESVYGLTYVRVPYVEAALGVPLALAVCISGFVNIPTDMGGFLEATDSGGGQPGDILNRNARHEIAAAVMKELRNYVVFDDGDVCQEKVYLKSNADQKLFLNVVGSHSIAPRIQYPAIENLYFAVGTQENPVQITTLECSIIGGIQAAQAVWTKNPASNGNRANPIEAIVPETWGLATLWAGKILLTPWAAYAKWWTVCEQAWSIPPGTDSGSVATVSVPERVLSQSGRLFAGAADTARIVGQTAVEAVGASFGIWSNMARAFQAGRGRRGGGRLR